MKKAKIGTDSTTQEHIKKLLTRFYATKDSSKLFTPTNLGVALVMGYDGMGYELWKPYLRAKMESDLKSVRMGTKSKAEVLETWLQQMKACFVDARLKKGKLFDAMAIFFERSNRSNGGEQHGLGDVVRKCGICQESDMTLRKKPDGNFMVGCLGFPQCRNVVWLPGSVSEATVTTNICSTCSPGPIYMIQFKFRQLEIPPSYCVDHLGCIGGCDNTLRQLVEICGTGSRNNSSVPGRGQGHTSSSSSAQQSNSRSQGGWQTAHSASSYPSQNPRAHNARPQEAAARDGESSVPCTSCGAPCNLRTANTAANRGRKFYSCQAQGCNFFVWEDDANNGGGTRENPRGSINRSASNPGRRGGRGRSNRGGGQERNETTFVSATGEPISGRCFVCGDPSHFANACPTRGSRLSSTCN